MHYLLNIIEHYIIGYKYYILYLTYLIQNEKLPIVLSLTLQTLKIRFLQLIEIV